MRSGVLLALVVLPLVGGLYAAERAPGARRPTPAQPAVLGHIQMRDHWVTVKAGELYTVIGRDGRVIAEDVTLKQLREIAPDVHRKLTETLRATGTGIAWAGM